MEDWLSACSYIDGARQQRTRQCLCQGRPGLWKTLKCKCICGKDPGEEQREPNCLAIPKVLSGIILFETMRNGVQVSHAPHCGLKRVDQTHLPGGFTDSNHGWRYNNPPLGLMVPSA